MAESLTLPKSLFLKAKEIKKLKNKTKHNPKIMKMGIDRKFRFWVHLASSKTTFSDVYLLGVSKDPTGHILGKESNHCRAQVTESLGSKNTHVLASPDFC